MSLTKDRSPPNHFGAEKSVFLEYTNIGFTAAAIPVSDFNKVFPLEPFSFIPSGKTEVFVCIE